MDRSLAFWVIMGLSMIGVVIFLGLRGLFRSALDSTAHLNKEKMEQLLAARTDFRASSSTFNVTSQSLLAFDDESLQVSRYFVQGERIMVQTFAAASIISVDILENAHTQVTALASSLPGTSISVAKAFSSTEVQSIALRFILDSASMPVVDHYFLDATKHGNFDANSAYVKDATVELNRIKALIDVMRHRVATPTMGGVLRGNAAINEQLRRDLESIHREKEVALRRLRAEHEERMAQIQIDRDAAIARIRRDRPDLR